MRMLFEDWYGLLRVVLVGASAYFALVLMLGVSGKRTLSKMNAFDFVVTVAIGSTLATVMLSKTVALAEGVLALALLIALQFSITRLSVRSPAVDRLVKSEPVLLLHRGKFLSDAMKAALKRRDRLITPNGSTRLEAGDVLTLIGGERAVSAAQEKLDGTG